MKLAASFHFHGSLNDFLSSSKKNILFSYQLNEASTIKDAIEALGAPHPEVFKIVVNDMAVDFRYRLKSGDSVEVHPYDEPVDYPGIDMHFVLDVHLGKLARDLRILGIDTLYQNDYTEKQIVQIATNEGRIILTRDKSLLKHASIRYGYCLRSDVPNEQLLELIRRFALKDWFKPFTRCLACNGIIRSVNKEVVAEQVPEKSRQYYHEFCQCEDCKRVYWKGSHYERMKQFVNGLN
jgi:hypothetical protein